MSEQNEKILLKWTFSEFIKYKRGIRWYITAFLVFAILFLYSIKSENFLFAVIIVMIALIIVNSHKKEPIKIQFTATDRGIKINKFFYPYGNFNKFWIVSLPSHTKKIYFEINNMLHTHLVVPANNHSSQELREILSKYIEEDKETVGEPVSEIIGRALKI